LKIEFELTDTQEATLNEIHALLKTRNADKTPNEIAQDVFIQFLINNKQQIVAQELRK